MQAFFLGDVKVICRNSLGDSHFQTNVIDDVENLFDYYLHIIFSVLCTLTSCTHYMQNVGSLPQLIGFIRFGEPVPHGLSARPRVWAGPTKG